MRTPEPTNASAASAAARKACAGAGAGAGAGAAAAAAAAMCTRVRAQRVWVCPTMMSCLSRHQWRWSPIQNRMRSIAIRRHPKRPFGARHKVPASNVFSRCRTVRRVGLAGFPSAPTSTSLAGVLRFPPTGGAPRNNNSNASHDSGNMANSNTSNS